MCSVIYVPLLHSREDFMPTITTKDGTQIYYKDWGKGQPIVFSHGWPLSADDWDTQMLFFLKHGYRVIAHDRRGHGHSSQTDGGHNMDHYADDLAALTAHLDLREAVHVGHSTGGGEVAHYLARPGTSCRETSRKPRGLATVKLTLRSSPLSPRDRFASRRSAAVATRRLAHTPAECCA